MILLGFKHHCNVNYIEHHGIKGMHWGVRRFRNKDGSLTSAGKKRYSEGEGEKKQLSKKQKIAIGVAVGVGVAAAGTALAVYGSKKSKQIKADNAKFEEIGKLLYESHAMNAKAETLRKEAESATGTDRILKEMSYGTARKAAMTRTRTNVGLTASIKRTDSNSDPSGYQRRVKTANRHVAAVNKRAQKTETRNMIKGVMKAREVPEKGSDLSESLRKLRETSARQQRIVDAAGSEIDDINRRLLNRKKK